MHPGRRDFSGGYRDDFRSFGRNAGMRGGYDDVEEEYDDGSYGYNNGVGMQQGGGGGPGSEVSNQLNLVAALLAQTLQQQQQQQQQQQHQSIQPPMQQRTSGYQSAHSLLGRPPQQHQQQPMQQFSGLMDDWSPGNMNSPRGVGRPGPSRGGGGGGRGRAGILGDPYNGQQASEVPSLLDMPPLRAGRGLWGGGEPRPGIKRRSDNWNETDSQKRRKEAATGDQNRGAAGSHTTGGKPFTGLASTPKDKATAASSAAAAKTGKLDTAKKPQAPASATPIKGKVSGTPDPQAGKAPADPLQKAAATVVKKEAVTAQSQKIDSPLAAEPLVYESGKVYGRDYVVPVTGYFCKLCHKFYSNVTAATVTHCQSEQHFAKYKATVAKKIKSLAATESETENASESILDDVPQAVSSSASATNIAQPEAEDAESAAVAAVTGDKSANSDPDAPGIAEVEPASELTSKVAEGDTLSANIGESVLGDVGSESAGLDGVGKAGNEADLDVSVASSANESVDEILDESPSAAVRGRRVKGRGSALRRGRK